MIKNLAAEHPGIVAPFIVAPLLVAA